MKAALSNNATITNLGFSMRIAKWRIETPIPSGVVALKNPTSPVVSVSPAILFR